MDGNVEMNENVYSMDGITNASNSCWSGDCIIVPDRSLGSTLPKSSFIHLFWYFPTQNHFQQYLTIQENILQKVIHGRSEIVSRNAASWGAAPRQNQKEKGQSLFLAKATPTTHQPTDMASIYLSFCQASPPYPCQQKDRRERSAKRGKVCLL